MTDRNIFILSNEDNGCSTAVKLTADNVRLLNWFIDFADLNYSLLTVDECADLIGGGFVGHNC